MKIRIKFSKEGTMKFIGHLDMMRYFQKVMRRADVDIRYSEGFSPHQIMSFASPLGVGMESEAEYVDIEVNTSDSSEEMIRRMNAVMVEGVRILDYRILPDSAAKAMSIVAEADYTARFREGRQPQDWAVYVDGLSGFLSQEQILIKKKTKKGEKEVDIRPMIRVFRIEGEEIFLKLAAGSTANLKPEAVLSAYHAYRNEDYAPFAVQIRRMEVYGEQTEHGVSMLLPLYAFGDIIE